MRNLLITTAKCIGFIAFILIAGWLYSDSEQVREIMAAICAEGEPLFQSAECAEYDATGTIAPKITWMGWIK